MTLTGERRLYSTTAGWLLNTLLFPLKMVVPQPVVARIPGLATNEDIRIGMVRAAVRGRLLDVGCGPNRLVEEYRLAGGEGIGVDVYPWPGVDTVVEDSARLPFGDHSFDSITFVACLNHIPNRDAALQEARRLIAPEGRLLLTNLRPFVSRLWHAWAFWDKDQHERGMREGETWGFTPSELSELLARCGWRVVERRSFSWGLNELWFCAPAG